MNKPSSGLPLTITFTIPAYWTTEQAFAVVELLDELRDRIWAHYNVQLPSRIPRSGVIRAVTQALDRRDV